MNRLTFVLVAIGLLLIANFLMVSGMTNWGPSAEGFFDWVADTPNPNVPFDGPGYEPIGTYDALRITPENKVSAWRGTAPNEPLLAGQEFTPGDDKLFIFANNQCKPECCGASFSCGGGCVCTTPAQRQMIAARGGNKTLPGDEF